MGPLDLDKLLARDPATTRAFERVITSYIRRFLRDRSRVESVSQAAWIEMMAKLRDGPHPSPERVRYWVANCASNAIRRELTRLRRNVVAYESWLHAHPESSPEELLAARQMLERIEELLDECSDVARLALEGAARGRSHRELADELGISQGAVGMAVLRARRRITHGLHVDERLEGLHELARVAGHRDRSLRLPRLADDDA